MMATISTNLYHIQIVCFLAQFRATDRLQFTKTSYSLQVLLLLINSQKIIKQDRYHTVTECIAWISLTGIPKWFSTVKMLKHIVTCILIQWLTWILLPELKTGWQHNFFWECTIHTIPDQPPWMLLLSLGYVCL